MLEQECYVSSSRKGGKSVASSTLRLHNSPFLIVLLPLTLFLAFTYQDRALAQDVTTLPIYQRYLE
jgi:hypothetical protein